MKKSDIILVLYCSILSTSLFGCSSKTPEPIDEKTFINGLKEEYAVCNYKLEQGNIEIDSACSVLTENGIVYVMNSTCSRCICEFMTFVERYKDANCTSSLSVVVGEQDSTTIEYYMEKANLDGIITNIIKNNSCVFVKDIIAENGAILLVRNNEIADSYKYVYE